MLSVAAVPSWFSSMSASLGVLVGVRAASVAMRGAHHFSTRRRQVWRARTVVCLPLAARGQVRSFGHAGAAGVFFHVHDCSVFFLPETVTPNHP